MTFVPIASSSSGNAYVVEHAGRAVLIDCGVPLKEIEARCGLSATCVVDNTNLGDETDPSLLLSSEAYARETAALCGLPLAFRSVLHTVPFPDDGRLFRMRS